MKQAAIITYLDVSIALLLASVILLAYAERIRRALRKWRNSAKKSGRLTSRAG